MKNKIITLALLVITVVPLFGSCLTKKTGNYAKDKRYPFFELWNKEDITKNKNDGTRTIYFLVGQDLAKLPGEPKALLPGTRALGWTVDPKDQLQTIDKNFIRINTKFDSKKPTYLALYKNSPASKPLPESLVVYQINPNTGSQYHYAEQDDFRKVKEAENTTIYLSWTKDRGLYSQTGQWLGVAGYTESCLDKSNNVKVDAQKLKELPQMTNITENARRIFSREYHKQEKTTADSNKQQAEELKKQKLKRNGYEFIRAAQVNLQSNKQVYPNGAVLFDLRTLDQSPVKIDMYAVLGLPLSARTKSNITKAFRALSGQIHPDKNLGNKDIATEAFKLLNDAYNAIINTAK